jgi:hypothetical protein
MMHMVWLLLCVACVLASMRRVHHPPSPHKFWVAEIYTNCAPTEETLTEGRRARNQLLMPLGALGTGRVLVH